MNLFFNLPNPSSCTRPEFLQPLKEMKQKNNISGEQSVVSA
jgi:hypothetical protein